MPRVLESFSYPDRVEVCTRNGRLIALFPVQPEYPPNMGLTEAQESAHSFIRAACLEESVRIAVGCLFHGNGSKQSVEQAIKTLRDAMNGDRK